MAQGEYKGATVQLYKIVDCLPVPTRRLPKVEETVQDKIAKLMSENAFELKPIPRIEKVVEEIKTGYCKTMLCDKLQSNKCCKFCKTPCNNICLNKLEVCKCNTDIVKCKKEQVYQRTKPMTRAYKTTLNERLRSRIKYEKLRERKGFEITIKVAAQNYVSREDVHKEKMKLYADGLTDREMAARLNTSQANICQWRSRHKLDINARVKVKK